MSAVLSSPPRSERVYVQRSPSPSHRADPAPEPIPELSIVALTRDARTIENDAIVSAGTEGTIVTVHSGGAAYDVEVPTGVVAVLASDVRRVG